MQKNPFTCSEKSLTINYLVSVCVWEYSVTVGQQEVLSVYIVFSLHSNISGCGLKLGTD